MPCATANQTVQSPRSDQLLLLLLLLLLMMMMMMGKPVDANVVVSATTAAAPSNSTQQPAPRSRQQHPVKAASKLNREGNRLAQFQSNTNANGNSIAGNG